ncbi:MAG: 50S ribosomal protein L11 [Candidatus Poribacteria bacterium]|nr:50S ribosomal protein L11 [Candidatus Poribacteria bacterium]
MAKKIAGVVKLQLVSGQATPNPPVGPSLAPYMINIPEFIKSFNAQTQDQPGLVVTTVVTCFADRSFSFEVKSPPTAVLLKQAARIAKGSGEPNRNKVASVTPEQIKEIAQTKLPDLNTVSLESAMQMVRGTARSMGITITG